MKIIVGLACGILFVVIGALLIAYICYRMAFYSPPRVISEDYVIPEGEIYEPYRDTMVSWIKEVRQLPKEEVSVTSFDGLTLRGTFYEFAPGAPIELMFHGYRGNGERDLCGGVQRCFALGRSALIVDQRGSGRSEGSVISFGINERKDCLTWIGFMIDHFGKDVQIILTGISMGAATVLMAGSTALPSNVKWILADCGYTSPKEIIQKVIHEMGLPEKRAYPFVKLGARLFGHFDLEEASPIDAMKQCTVPVIFFHGACDAFVPCEMSRRNFDACGSKKKLVTVPKAGHGLCYLIDGEGYLQALRNFQSSIKLKSEINSGGSI